MSRARDEDGVPPRFNDENNTNNNQEGDKSGASGPPSLEVLMRWLEKLTTKNKKLRAKAKGKKIKGSSSWSEEEDSSFEEEVFKKGKKGRRNHDKPSNNSMSFNWSEEKDSSFEEEVSKKGKKRRRNHDKPSNNSMSFNYNNIPSSTAYIFIPVGKTPYFEGTSYNQWKHCMKNYLYSISSEVWQVVCDGVEFLDGEEQPTSDEQ
jgi:hypothetical protein